VSRGEERRGEERRGEERRGAGRRKGNHKQQQKQPDRFLRIVSEDRENLV
jgi:hypothetical protein